MKKQPSDEELKVALAKMLPEVVGHEVIHGYRVENVKTSMWWLNPESPTSRALGFIDDTELLHLCWLVEQEFDDKISDVRSLYLDYLGCVVGWNDAKNPADAQFEACYNSVRAPWQQRVIGLARVKNIEL